jgi:hypothetical protein
VGSRCIFLKTDDVRTPHERGHRLRQIGPIGQMPAVTSEPVVNTVVNRPFANKVGCVCSVGDCQRSYGLPHGLNYLVRLCG